jgi:hypothetical protein
MLLKYSSSLDRTRYFLWQTGAPGKCTTTQILSPHSLLQSCPRLHFSRNTFHLRSFPTFGYQVSGLFRTTGRDEFNLARPQRCLPSAFCPRRQSRIKLTPCSLHVSRPTGPLCVKNPGVIQYADRIRAQLAVALISCTVYE